MVAVEVIKKVSTHRNSVLKVFLTGTSTAVSHPPVLGIYQGNIVSSDALKTKHFVWLDSA